MRKKLLLADVIQMADELRHAVRQLEFQELSPIIHCRGDLPKNIEDGLLQLEDSLNEINKFAIFIKLDVA